MAVTVMHDIISLKGSKHSHFEGGPHNAQRDIPVATSLPHLSPLAVHLHYSAHQCGPSLCLSVPLSASQTTQIAHVQALPYHSRLSAQQFEPPRHFLPGGVHTRVCRSPTRW